MEGLPPLEVLIGFVLIVVVGTMLGATICLPIAHKNSKLTLEQLSGDLIWRYAPDWFLSVMGCVITLVL